MSKPNFDDFLKFSEESGLHLSRFQKDLAKALINYRTIHFSGGLRSGRSTVVNAVREYFDKEFPHIRDAGREI